MEGNGRKGVPMSERLRTFRESKGKTVKEMADEIGVSASYYYKVESGLRTPSYNFVAKFKKAFGVSVDDFFFG